MMKKMKRIVVAFLAVVIIMVMPVMISGCEEYDPQLLAQYSEQADVYKSQIAELQASVQPILADLEAGGVISVQQMAKLDTVNEEIAKKLALFEQLKAEIDKVKYSGDKFDDTLATGQAINNALAGINPWYAHITAMLTIAGLTKKLFSQKKEIKVVKEKSDRAETAVVELVSGIEQVKKVSSDTAAIGTAMNAAQSVDTQQKVASIRKTLKV